MTPEEIAAADAAKKKENEKPDLSKEIEALKARNAELDKKLAEYTSKQKTDDDDDLLEKSRKNRKSENDHSDNSKALENALKFSLKSEDFLKVNASLLPKGIEDLFKTAEKENYSNAIEKVSAIKAGIIQEFFSIQSNVDLLTPGLKTSLDDFLKLTKTGKQEKAPAIYDGVFEPAFEMLKRVKKTEALSKGYGGHDDADTAYKNKMVTLSRKHFLGEK